VVSVLRPDKIVTQSPVVDVRQLIARIPGIGVGSVTRGVAVGIIVKLGSAPVRQLVGVVIRGASYRLWDIGIRKWAVLNSTHHLGWPSQAVVGKDRYLLDQIGWYVARDF
jgi:hypothetical protein